MSKVLGKDLLAQLRARFDARRPVRAGSLIVTLYGDAIAPRGGSLWLGSINRLLEPFGIEPGLIRTAMSRLVADGLFERNRVGKNSYYRLSAGGTREFADAAAHIYAPNAPIWNGRFDLAVLPAGEAKDRQSLRDALSMRGFGQLAPNVMVRPAARSPASGDVHSAGNGIVWLVATPRQATDDVAGLVQSAWNLDELDKSYRSFLHVLAPMIEDGRALARLPDEDAFLARVLLIHEWRRIVLRDPGLPAELLPTDWSGARARAAVAAIYRAISPGCDRWLDGNATAETGLLPASRGTANRFKPG